MKKGLVKKNRKGFTLIELVVVIAILGILAAILIPVIGGFIQRANDAANMANARALYGAVALALTEPNHGIVTRATSTDALPANVAAMFGPLPSGDSAGYEITGTGLNAVVTSAEYNGQTYSR